MTPTAPAASSSLVRFVKTELHSLLGAGGAAYGLNAHSTKVALIGAGYALAMKGLAIVGAYVSKAAAKNPDVAGAAKVVDTALDTVAPELPAPYETAARELAAAPVTAAMQAGAP
ncbi:MAG: hypothetical protein ABSE66_09675 [Thermoplasmata archaeon]